MSKKRKPLNNAAIVTIYRAPFMTRKDRRDVAEWLRRQADMLVSDGELYSETRFTARYLCR